MDKLQGMRAFVGVVEAGSFSAAAARLELAKSVISRRVSELEAELGVQLFRRTTRRLNLTDTGRSYYERCLQILADIEEADHAVSREHGALHGRLKIALPLAFGLRHLAGPISEFACAHPGIEFDLDFNDRRVDLLQEGFDVGVRIGKLEDSTLIARPFTEVHTTICASPDYLARRGTPETPDELDGHDAIVYSNLPDADTWTWWDADGVKHKKKVNVVMRANSGEFLHRAALAGRGMILTPTFISRQDIANGKLRALFTDLSWPRSTAWAIYPQTRHLSQRVRAFVDFLVEKFAGIPPWDRP